MGRQGSVTACELMAPWLICHKLTGAAEDLTPCTQIRCPTWGAGGGCCLGRDHMLMFRPFIISCKQETAGSTVVHLSAAVNQ